MFHATELATCAQYQVPLIICVFNDSGYGVLRYLQQNRFGRINETDLGKVALRKWQKAWVCPVNAWPVSMPLLRRWTMLWQRRALSH